MSSFGHGDWPETEAGYWETTRRARDREDAKLVHEHATRVEHIKKDLKELYQKKARLQNAVDDVEASIVYQQAEEQRLIQDFNQRQHMLQKQREEEDRTQQLWFARVRESNLFNAKEKAPVGKSSAQKNDPTPTKPVPVSSSANGALRRSTRVAEQRSDLFSSVFHNPIEEDAGPSSRPSPPCKSIALSQADTGSTSSAAGRNASVAVAKWNIAGSDIRDSVEDSKPVRHKLPMLPIANREGDSSSAGSRHSSLRRKSLPSLGDRASQTNSPAAEPAGPIPEITRRSMKLRDDGSQMVWPPMYFGVPLEKIDEHHPFWNPEWEPLEKIIQPILDKWLGRQAELVNDPHAIRHNIFLAGRQVNRGQAVMKFLQEGSIHPFQFANREIMDKAYKTFINYDTLFRLVSTHEELKKFELDVTPLEWLRQRMYEVSLAQGEKFNLSKSINKLYHDEKLKALREKHGFGNIGRPSGYKVGGKDAGKDSGKDGEKGKVKGKTRQRSVTMSGDEQQDDMPRRSRRSIGQVGTDDEPQSPAGLCGDGHPVPLAPCQPRQPRQPKRQRMDFNLEDSLPVQKRDLTFDDLEYEGYSSRDSSSSGRIMHLDFRVHQIKTKTMATHPSVTQYLTWKPEENKFAHQVLRVHPTTSWDQHRGSQVLSSRLEEMREVRYARDSQKVLVARADATRGDVVVHFKRERTKKRFLAFTKKKGVNLVRVPKFLVEAAWDQIDMLSDEDQA